jgi:hypothetical protein
MPTLSSERGSFGIEKLKATVCKEFFVEKFDFYPNILLIK